MSDENLSKGERERLARLKASRWRLFRKILVWLLVIGGIAAGSVWAVKSTKKSEANKPGISYANQGNAHITPGTEHPPYNSNPPTSGPHWASPAAWGVYDQALPDEQFIHNLEHGGIWISYKDPQDQDLVGKLKDIAGQYTIKVILTPRPQNDEKIAVAAWGRLLKLDQFDRGQILDFIKTYINKGPEDVPY